MTLETALRQHGIPYEKHTHQTAMTAQRLAEAEHISGYQVAKPVVVKSSDGFAMCVLPAPAHLDLHRVASLLGDSQVRLATEQELAGLFPDCELGAEPPVGKLFGLPTIADEQLIADDFLEMQAGKHTESLRVRREDWEALTHPLVAAIARD